VDPEATKRTTHSRSRAYTWLAVLFALALACSRLPALFVAAAEATPERVFLGYEADAATAIDLHYYTSYVYDARERPTLFFADRATTEPQEGRVVSLYFTTLGLVAKWSGASIPAVWNGARVVVVLLFCLALWKVLALFFAAHGPRFLAYALITFGGGFGWLMLLLRGVFGEHDALALADLAKDGIIGYTTFGYVYHPQALLGETCFLGALWGFARWRETRRVVPLGVALLLATLIFAVHSPSAPVFYAALIASPLVPLLFRASLRGAWARARAVAVMTLPMLVFGGYLFWASGDPVFRGFADTYAKLRHLREPPFWYLIGYGVVLWLAVFGARALHAVSGPRAAQALDEERRDLLWGWLFAAFLFSINPLLFAWKFQFALQLPLVILAVYGAPVVWERITSARLLAGLRERRVLAAGFLLIVSCLSSLFLFGRTLARAGDEGLFAAPDELHALAELAKMPRGNVLSRYRTGTLLISHTPHKAYIAHYSGTLEPARKDDDAQAFFDRTRPLAPKKKLLERAQIRYVVEGPREREKGGVDAALPLRVVKTAGRYRVFEVVAP